MTLRCKNAPRDGRWILINIDHNDDNDHWHLGRWKPEMTKIGDQWLTYEWEYLRWGRYEFDHYADGHVCDWKPLPE